MWGWGSGRGGGRVGLGGQGGCEQRIEAFVKFQIFFGGVWSEGGGGVGLGGGGVRVDVNEELKFLRKFTKKSEMGRGGVEVVFGLGESGWM